MKMTINESKRLLSNYLDGVTNYCERELIDKAIKVAISTMRKYQKIQEIAEKCNLKLLPKEGMSTFMKDVLEVLEDGNDK